MRSAIAGIIVTVTVLRPAASTLLAIRTTVLQQSGQAGVKMTASASSSRSFSITLGR